MVSNRYYLYVHEVKASSFSVNNQVSKEKYDGTNILVEKLSEIIYIALVKVTVPGFVIPIAIICYFRYFSLNLDNDALLIPLPLW